MKRSIKILLICVCCIVCILALSASALWLMQPENRPGAPEYIFKHEYTQDKLIGLTQEDIIATYGAFDRTLGETIGMYYLGERYDGCQMYCQITFDKGVCTSVEYIQAPGG